VSDSLSNGSLNVASKVVLVVKIAAREMPAMATRTARRMETWRISARLAESLRYRIGGIDWVGGRVLRQFLRVFRAFRLRV